MNGQGHSQQDRKQRHNYKGGGDSKPNSNIPDKREVQRFIHEENAVADMVKRAEVFGRYLKNNKVTSTQLRNAYGTMKKLEMVGWSPRTQTKVILIKPRLAYAAGRHGNGMKDLSQVIGWAIDAIRNEKDFQRFCHFFEAIVAYFKAAGGK